MIVLGCESELLNVTLMNILSFRKHCQLENLIGPVLFQRKAEVEDVVLFIKDHQTSLVGHLTRKNQAALYTKRPLCVVYYTVDFSFDHRKGKIS
jgi:hypothetical protein